MSALVLATLFSLLVSYGNATPLTDWECKDGERKTTMLMPYLKSGQKNEDKPNLIGKCHSEDGTLGWCLISWHYYFVSGNAASCLIFNLFKMNLEDASGTPRRPVSHSCNSTPSSITRIFRDAYKIVITI